jgi:hypothetical protein
VAVLDKTALLFSGVHNLKRRRSQGETIMLRLHRVRTHLIDLIALYQPMVIVVEEVSPRRLRQAPILSMMVSEIIQIAQEYGIPVRRYSVDGVVSCLSELHHDHLYKKDIATNLVQRYPHLSYHLAPSPSPQWKYWQPMIEAIGLGLTFFLQEEQRNGR